MHDSAVAMNSGYRMQLPKSVHMLLSRNNRSIDQRMDRLTRPDWWINLTFASSAAQEALGADLPNCDWDNLFVWSRELKVPLASLRG